MASNYNYNYDVDTADYLYQVANVQSPTLSLNGSANAAEEEEVCRGWTVFSCSHGGCSDETLCE